MLRSFCPLAGWLAGWRAQNSARPALPLSRRHIEGRIDRRVAQLFLGSDYYVCSVGKLVTAVGFQAADRDPVFNGR
ncbi:hypothetical protein K469DRAFT_706429 [Zopfia rhizophila CBS 207.26]|uniref:Uncharacterized protein n=1 Tax=Zopfia rhizophila CBS 207.26 TaxID=1314779 RepID=A0A6A6E3R3_9PEZI|nr:hypothetical protein K469DRAFT_706429 [Zopfia rhizophila CBS 207.26]